MTSKMKDIMQIEKSNIPLNEPLLQIQINKPFPYNMQPYSRIISRKNQYNFKTKHDKDIYRAIPILEEQPQIF